MNIQEYEKELFKNLINKCKENDINHMVESIIITGSFGRKEQTYNNNKLKSDIEIGFVYKPFTRKKEIKNLAWKIQEMFNEDLNIMGMSRYRILKKCNYNNTIIPTSKKTIFTYDLYNGSYTLYGKKYIEKININKKDIDVYEAKRIIANRIAEYLYLTKKSKDNFLKTQWKSKIILAIGSAWLVLNNKYESSYKSQMETILDNEPLFDKSFLDTYKKSYNFLRNNGDEYNIEDKEIQEYIRNFNSQYNLHKINKSKVNGLSRKVKYFLKFIKSYGIRKHLFNIEDYIIQRIIDNYTNNNEDMIEIANMWFNVIY